MADILYRIQDSKGRGPFAPGVTKKWKTNFEMPPPFFIEFPNLISINKKGMNAGCACRTKEQLKAWVTEEEYKKLLNLGFQCIRIDADEILNESENQCVFLRKRQFRKGVNHVNLY